MVSLLYSISTALGGKVAILEDMIINKNYRNKGFGKQIIAGGNKFFSERKLFENHFVDGF